MWVEEHTVSVSKVNVELLKENMADIFNNRRARVWLADACLMLPIRAVTTAALIIHHTNEVKDKLSRLPLVDDRFMSCCSSR